MVFYIWMVLLWSLGLGSATKRHTYEAALHSALTYAKIRDLYKPFDVRDFRENSTISKILYVPPYRQFVSKIRTSMPGKPVDLKYIFIAKKEGDSNNLMCTTTIYEFKDRGRYYYILPSGHNVKCEKYESEREEHVDELRKKKRPKRFRRIKKWKQRTSLPRKLENPNTSQSRDPANPQTTEPVLAKRTNTDFVAVTNPMSHQRDSQTNGTEPQTGTKEKIIFSE